MDLLLLAIAIFYVVTNRKTEWVLTIMLALSTQLFQTSKFFSSVMFIPNMYDGALVILFSLLIKYWKRKAFLYSEYKKMAKYVEFFILYIIFLIIIDLLLNNVSIISIIKTSRHWLFLLVIFIIPKINVNILRKTLYFVMYITIVISAIISFEFITGVNYFTEIRYENGVARGALPSTFALFYTMILACNYYKISKKKRYIYMTILIISLLASSTRSIALAIVFGCMICIYFCSKNKVNSLAKMFVFILISGTVVMFTPGLKERFSEMNAEIMASRNSNDIEGNTTFRFMHFSERYEYLKQTPRKFLFGLGNIVEEDFPYVFYLGLYNDKMQRTYQLNTGDITWSLALIRLGVVGIILFVMFAFKMTRCAAKFIPDKLSVAVIAYLIITFIVISFAGTGCYEASFWIMPTICLCIIGDNAFLSKNRKEMVNI